MIIFIVKTGLQLLFLHQSVYGKIPDTGEIKVDNNICKKI